MNNSPISNEDRALVNACIPAPARALNVVYNTFFNPFNKALNWLTTNWTRHLVSSFDKKI